MNAHANHSSPMLARFATWVNTKWQARRARRLEEETVVYLSAMDAKLMNDIGMDIDRLGELTHQRPDAANENEPASSRHSSRDKRS
jgi:hypothetical protein